MLKVNKQIQFDEKRDFLILNILKLGEEIKDPEVRERFFLSCVSINEKTGEETPYFKKVENI